MYNFTPDIDTAVIETKTVWAKLRQADDTMQQEAEEQGEGYQSYILSAINGKRRGGEWEIKKFLRHLEKGCY